MKSYCGAECNECGRFGNGCKGCTETGGQPFGKQCLIAEYIKVGGEAAFQEFEKKLISEINALGVEGLPEVKGLNALEGAYVNLAYPLPSGEKVKFLCDEEIYLGTQVEPVFGESERCFGIVANASFILVVTYGCNGSDPELVLYKKR